MQEGELKQILNVVYSSVLAVDSGGNVTYLNSAAEHLTGWKDDDSLGRSIEEIIRIFHEETSEPLVNPLSVAMKEDRVIYSTRPALLINRGGNESYIESRASPIRDDRGRITGGVLVLEDISETREIHRRLNYFVSHDILTGVYNRREYLGRLSTALRASKENAGSHAICYLNLDQFKIINESCGHSAGDALLGEIGALLKSKIRWRDTLARLGGDEFAVLLDGCSPEEAKEVAEALRVAVSEHSFVWGERVFRVNASIGLAQLVSSSGSMDDILVIASTACRAAKQAGGNAVYAATD